MNPTHNKEHNAKIADNALFVMCGMNQELGIRQQQVLHDKKWIKFLRRTWIFRLIPFVDFALAAGSMATGNVHPDSDFDVIVGAKYGRIFTVRFFCTLAFGFFGWRRKRMHGSSVNELMGYGQRPRVDAADKVCLNHFVTDKSYRLSPPHNAYWRNLYQNLVPIFGDHKKIDWFFSANADWVGEHNYTDDLRHRRICSWVKKLREYLLGGRFGDWLEKILRNFQIKRIERTLKKDSGYKPRIIYSDEELEFHPDTRRTEVY